jgi:hypothetical protein
LPEARTQLRDIAQQHAKRLGARSG